MSNTDYDIQEKTDFHFSIVPACANCKTTESFLTDYWPADQDKSILLCEECCEAEAAIEKQADQLAALPSCDGRQQLIDGAQTTRGLVNALKAHDFECASCASTRKTVASDRLYVASAAVCCEGKVA